MRITSGFMTNLSGDNIDSSTGSGIEGGGLGSKSGGLAHGMGLDEGLGSKSGGLAHGRGLDEGLGSKSGGLAHGMEAFRALRAPLYATRGVASEECECRKIGSPTEGAAGRPPKGFAAKEGV